MPHDYVLGLAGGILMGVACAALVLFNGRILGVSGLLGGALAFGEGASWRWAFIVGMLCAGTALYLAYPSAFVMDAGRGVVQSLVGGVLVGVGTQLGSGCTSGHGICGMGRLSRRSIVATLVFMATGAIAVGLIQHVLGGEL
jgi:hypothetical protein